MSKKLKIALPKGSLQDSTVELFRKAGYNIYVSSRGYRRLPMTTIWSSS